MTIYREAALRFFKHARELSARVPISIFTVSSYSLYPTSVTNGPGGKPAQGVAENYLS
jgi:hypothetical protein